MVVNRDCSVSANSNSAIDDLRKQMLDLAETVENKIENLRREVHKLDAKIEPMQILECSLSDLKRDKMRLLQDNNELRERNLNLCLITSDLNTRIKDLERERDYSTSPQGQGHHNSVSQLVWARIIYPPCQLFLWEETGVPGENPRLRQSVDCTLFT